MSYSIDSYLKGELRAKEAWGGMTFTAAQDHAKAMVETGIADRVEVRDEAGQLLFHFPRVTRGA